MDENDFWYVFVFHSSYYFDEKEEKQLKKLKGKDQGKEKVKDIEEYQKKYKEIFRIHTTEAEDDNLGNLAPGEMISERQFAEFIYKQLKVKFENNLGIELNETTGSDKNEIYLKMRTCDQNLKLQAEHMEYKLKINIEPIDPMTKKKHKFKQYDAYGHFKTIVEESKYKKNDHNDLFNFSDKVRILFSMISAAIDLSELNKMGLLITHYPMPYKHRLVLSEFSSGFGRLDLELVKKHFGEKIAMYFAWLEYYIYWLLIPATLGIISGSLYYASSNDKIDQSRITLGEWSLLIFALLLSVCSTLMDQFWARKQSELAWKWGVADFYEVEEQRIDYRGTVGRDPVSGKWKKIDHESKLFTKLLGVSITVFFVALVVAAVLGLIIYKSTLTLSGNVLTARWVGICNAFQIKIFNFIYRYVAVELTNLENYETQTQYNNTLIIRLFSFQFINSYISLFYIAFGRRYFEGCTNNDCLYDLTLQLTSIFFTHLFLNIIELGLPIATKVYRNICKKRKIAKQSEKSKNESNLDSKEESQE